MITVENTIVAALGIAPGLFLGYLTAKLFLEQFQTDWFSFELQMYTSTFVFAGLAILAVFPDLLVWISDLFGIGYPPATFMLLALSFLLVLVLHFSWELSRLEDRTRALAEEYALLRGELDERFGARDRDGQS